MAGALPGAAAPMADPLLTVTSQMATAAKRREEPLRGHGQKDRASSDPQQSLQEALSLLGSDDWELKEKGLFMIKILAGSHSEVLLFKLHEVCLAVTSEVTNLRSKVSYSAIVTLGELFVTLKKDMDSEVDEVLRVLLQMVWNSSEFVQKAASQTLGIMVENVTPARAMTALMDMGVKSRHAQVRKCAAELLLSLMERIGVTKLAGTPRAERLAHVAGKLAQDCHKDTRHYGQEMVRILLSHQKFKMLLERSLSTCDLEDILTRIKKKGMENQKAECPSVKELLKKRNDGSKKPQATVPSSKRVKSTSDGRLLHRAKAQVMLPPAVEGRESLQKLYHLLEAKGFQTRLEGVALLQDLCKTSPQLICTNIVQIFDYFVLRISDSNKKVKQKALDVLAEIIGLLEDALNPVMIRLVEGITKNLNSKDPRVHARAVKALDESVAHLNKVSLLKEFSHQWSKLSGQALLDVTERITGMASPSKARALPREYLQGMPVNRQQSSSSKSEGAELLPPAQYPWQVYLAGFPWLLQSCAASEMGAVLGLGAELSLGHLRTHLQEREGLKIPQLAPLWAAEGHLKSRGRFLFALRLVGRSCVSLPAVLVEWVYARSPEVVQRYALPVLWSFLENKALPVRSANVCTVVTKLACALCELMGTQLIKCADSKPPHVRENLSSLLGW
ncbi:TOG array regulator of axonemal microtubules protein 2-like [Haemorhous mexicanus]|uniref:TOG array regulator of axonemal microtubules protein 2-like n=1 Tax=Haemorhous mexicanus TaxID=30427 RepID=UPI0028BD1854|nr:TOG array regulator of axonemal microtubules protein 2-like [Haemorhous mexicanus]